MELVERLTELEEEAGVHKLPILVRVRGADGQNVSVLLDSRSLALAHTTVDGTPYILIDLT